MENLHNERFLDCYRALASSNSILRFRQYCTNASGNTICRAGQSFKLIVIRDAISMMCSHNDGMSEKRKKADLEFRWTYPVKDRQSTITHGLSKTPSCVCRPAPLRVHHKRDPKDTQAPSNSRS